MTSRRVMKGPPPTPVKRLEGLPYELQQVQSAIDRSTRKSRSDPHARGVKVRVTATAGGAQTVSHKLGRKPIAFDMIQLKGATSYTLGKSNSRQFTISLSGAGTLDFWVW